MKLEIGTKVMLKNEISQREATVIGVTSHWNDKPNQFLYLLELANGSTLVKSGKCVKSV
jgi:hypothetical protein